MFHAKIKMSKFRVNIAFFGYFWVEFEKSHYHVWNHPRFFLRESFVRNWKSFNLRIKLPYLSIFRLKFEKEAIVTFEATSDFSKRESFVQNSKSLNLGPILFYLSVLGRNFKKLFSYLKSKPSNLSDCRIFRKNKNSWIWDQKSLI